MRRPLLLLCFLAVVLAVAGCGNKGPLVRPSKAPAAAPAAATSAPPVAAPVPVDAENHAG